MKHNDRYPYASDTVNEQRAAQAFTKQSVLFDDYFSGNLIIQYKRERVRNLVKKYFGRPGKVLELNSGTGEDAIWFAEQGHQVHATDISSGMQEVLTRKVKARAFEKSISTECCSFTNLAALQNQGPYDLIFSNFAGLNCTGNLDSCLLRFKDLLNPKGLVILAILPKFCLWETALLFLGKFRTAFRRFFSKNGARARVEGNDFTCWYYNPSYITKTLDADFQLLHLEGLCCLVPPSYLEGFPEKHPGLYRYLKKKEAQLKGKWPWKHIGDYYLIVLQKKDRSPEQMHIAF